MRRHGATVAGTSIRELIFRSVFGSDNCKLLAQAMAMGHVDSLSPAKPNYVGAPAASAFDQPRLGLLGAQVEKAGLCRKRARAAARAAKRAKAKAARKTPAKAKLKKRR